MNLEQRAVLCDDIGRQVLSYGERKSAQELSDLIEKVPATPVDSEPLGWGARLTGSFGRVEWVR